MAAKFFQVGFAIVSMSTIGLTTLVPIPQAQAQTPSVAAQPIQDSNFFLKRAIESMENDSSDQAMQAALGDLNQAIKLNPKNAAAYAHQGSLVWQTDRKAGMLNFDRAVELAPDDLDVRGFRASYRELSGDNGGAIVDLNHILKLAPTESEPRYLRAVILKRDAIKDYKAALVDLDYLIGQDQVLKHRSNAYRDGRYQMRAEVRQKLGDQKGAIADLQVAESTKAEELESSKRTQKALEMELEGLRSLLQRLQSGK